MSFPSKMAAVPKRRPFFGYNSGTVRHTAMKIDTDVPRGDPRNILEEQTNLICITITILENGGRCWFFVYNSGRVIDTGTKFLIQMFAEWFLISATYFKSLCHSLSKLWPFQDGGRSKMAAVFCL
jgi:hypothetical protein